ncbi:MAG TPA: OsmC family protein [Gaiellaceae bacterium]|jgi:organic hydroperoxide reductase OsmC/OhrA
MSVMKELQFPVSVRWRGGHVARADARGKDSLALATPPEFRSGLAGHWTPEELLVTSAASCFALTLAAVADRHDAPLVDVTVAATGHMSRRDDGRFGFTVVEIDARLETAPGGEDAVRQAAAEAERRCLVSAALDVPVHVAVTVEEVAEPTGEPAGEPGLGAATASSAKATGGGR